MDAVDLHAAIMKEAVRAWPGIDFDAVNILMVRQPRVELCWPNASKVMIELERCGALQMAYVDNLNTERGVLLVKLPDETKGE